jgi:hypothetical protein
VAEQQQQQQQKPLELEDIFAVGTLIGNRYQVLKKLGDGGTADVFECTDLFVGDTVCCDHRVGAEADSAYETPWHCACWHVAA